METVAPALDSINGAMDAVRSRQDVPSGTLRINAFASLARGLCTAQNQGKG